MNTKVFAPNTAYSDYQPHPSFILVNESERERAECVVEILHEYPHKLVITSRDNFFRILRACSNLKTEDQYLQVYTLLVSKDDEQIMADLDVKEITPDEMIERLIQLMDKIKKWSVLGYCMGYVVTVDPSPDGLVVDVEPRGLCDATFDIYS